MPVTVVPYSEEWPQQYEKVANSLREMLSQVSVVAIEHVGSTSVPGLAAKPILDIDIIVQREHLPAASAPSPPAGTFTSEISASPTVKRSARRTPTPQDTSIFASTNPCTYATTLPSDQFCDQIRTSETRTAQSNKNSPTIRP